MEEFALRRLESRSVAPESEIRLGTSSFTAAGWEEAFYPAGIKPAEYLSYYATQFDTVELDNTFYRTPALSTVKGWYAKTPPGFLFAAKVPQIITHEKALADCDEDFHVFLKAMDCLGEELGPLLLQFGYFNKKVFAGVNEFLARLVPFLKKLPQGLSICRGNPQQKLARARIGRRAKRTPCRSRAGGPRRGCPVRSSNVDRVDPITADFTYVRWLGDRKGIEEKTKTWNKIIMRGSNGGPGRVESQC